MLHILFSTGYMFNMLIQFMFFVTSYMYCTYTYINQRVRCHLNLWLCTCLVFQEYAYKQYICNKIEIFLFSLKGLSVGAMEVLLDAL